jgi:hypothetical protein
MRNQIDRSAIDCIEIDCFVETYEKPERPFYIGQPRMRDSNAIAGSRRTRCFAQNLQDFDIRTL